jgi:hypothetical protein
MHLSSLALYNCNTPDFVCSAQVRHLQATTDKMTSITLYHVHNSTTLGPFDTDMFMRGNMWFWDEAGLIAWAVPTEDRRDIIHVFSVNVPLSAITAHDVDANSGTVEKYGGKVCRFKHDSGQYQYFIRSLATEWAKDLGSTTVKELKAA